MGELLAELGGVVQIGAGGIVALIVGAILTGRLIPRSVHERELARADAAKADMVHERDLWKETAESKDVTIYTQAQSIRDLMAVGATAEKVINALPTPRGDGA